MASCLPMVPNVTTPEKKNQGIHVLAYKKSGSPFLKEEIMETKIKIVFLNLPHRILKKILYAHQILDSHVLNPVTYKI